MNFDIYDTKWLRLDDLIDNSTYFLQAKRKMYQDYFEPVEILFTQIPHYPYEIDDGFYGSDIKFQKRAGEDVYIRTLETPVNIQIEAIAHE